MVESLIKDLENVASEERAIVNRRFFKTCKGEYGEGDQFIGVTVPDIRKVAMKYAELSFKDLDTLMTHTIHEFRLAALVILVNNFKNANIDEKQEIVNYYVSRTSHINNWDLVDLSADKILGEHLLDKDKSLLYEFAKSSDLWERRIAIVSTFGFIKKNQFKDTLKISEILLHDKHDLIHKAVGWMLREVGKRDQEVEEQFLKKHYKLMPRTMLRYAIERFYKEKKAFYMKK